MKGGFSVVEALVALGLTAVALAGLTAAAATSVAHVRLTRERATALELAASRLEGLRAGPRTSEADTVESAGTTFTRSWEVDDGRGGPARFHVEVTWAGGHIALSSGAFP